MGLTGWLMKSKFPSKGVFWWTNLNRSLVFTLQIKSAREERITFGFHKISHDLRNWFSFRFYAKGPSDQSSRRPRLVPIVQSTEISNLNAHCILSPLCVVPILLHSRTGRKIFAWISNSWPASFCIPWFFVSVTKFGKRNPKSFVIIRPPVIMASDTDNRETTRLATNGTRI